MLVKDLVRDTIWMPGKDYDPSHKPQISVLLPTFRRGKSGLFRRCVESILAQTLEDIELIIIDDASTDGTADQIAEYLANDSRVGCLRHPKNIGLPAISEYEGYLKARADRLAFAFDDTMFNEDALAKLLEESKKAPHAVVYGHIEWSHKDQLSDDIVTSRLGSDRSQGLLRLSNHIPNNAVLMPRTIVEDVGLYDPHIGMARICDWDLWGRIADSYELKFVDVAVGQEGGPMQSDSVGNTYALDSAASDEWMRTYRNERLRPENFGEYDVFSLDANLGQSTLTIFEGLARKHGLPRGWSVPVPVSSADTDGYILIVTVDYNASTTLCFDMLPPSIARRVRVITLSGIFSYEELARATCVIFVRVIAPLRIWIDAAKSLGIPCYYFLDDNLPLLQSNKEIVIPGEDFSTARFGTTMKMFEGVLLSSRNLVTYFREHLLHDNLHYFPVSFYRQAPLSLDYQEKKLPGETVIVFAGGSHRSRGMHDVVFPAVRKLAEGGRPVHLVMAISDGSRQLESEARPENLRITLIPFDVSYLFAMRRFARFSPDYMVHAPSETTNNAYKTLNPLVAALMLDCVLIAPETEPYIQVADRGNLVLVNDAAKPISWYETFVALLDKKVDVTLTKERNREYCRENFSGQANEFILREMLRKHGGEASWSEQSRRLYKLMSWTRSKGGIPVEHVVLGPADETVRQLGAYRKMVRYSWRHRLMQRRTDLWDSTAESFKSIKAFSEKEGWRRHASSLELSDSLSDMPFREYRVNPPAGKLKAVLLAISVDLVQQGIIGIEIVNPRDEIRDHIAVDLQTANLNVPVRFELSGVNVRHGETWKIRIFAKAKVPVYVFEFINKRFMGLRYTNPTPFMELVME
ncbi:hypothetical protein A6V36_15950 [Paraburkholderia ginsengiterrae]|uniref:Glycosyltransferase 2-like domain-containing protein n=1 Tax=Paraburkholderia ginsengiterrae TaxID=1462993 RepID=A0A1A9NDP4_9BURK|nr:glycosyltransferase [Paraburkholderia ginsengiterrae]OAJ51517.1 hypothetical protein A6V36_15950 [Paraburkholderia ginsengiterrae]OAJ64530.1 hypothetical protein A6V37_18890 [Paraburkholderia ginsengiterrae]